MDQALTIDQINQAFAVHIAAAKEEKCELAEAVRHCCHNLPVGEKLRVADNTVKKIKAVCETRGGRSSPRPGSYTKTVLLINGRLADEPPFEIEAPDSLEHDWPAVWTGPESGWYDAADQRKYDRLCQQFPDDEDSFDAPSALEECSLAELLEVARAIPETMSLWCSARLQRLEAEASNSQALAAALRQQADALSLKV